MNYHYLPYSRYPYVPQKQEEELNGLSTRSADAHVRTPPIVSELGRIPSQDPTF